MKNSKFWLACVIVALLVCCALECRQNRKISRQAEAKRLRDSLVIDSLQSYFWGDDTLDYLPHAPIPGKND